MPIPHTKSLAVSLILIAISTLCVAASDLSLDEALTILMRSREERHLKEVEQWQSLMKTVTWWDSNREHRTKASYIHSTENTVTLRKATGEDVTVPIAKLDFHSRVRVSQIRKLEGQLREDATAFLATEDTKRGTREKADEAKRKEHAEMETMGDEAGRRLGYGGGVLESPPLKADVSIGKSEDPDSNVTSDSTNAPQALRKLLAKVTAISPEDLTRYETLLRDPTPINLLLYHANQGPPGSTCAEVQEAINLGLEKPAVSALIKLIQETKSSTDKAELLSCAQSIKALGQFSSSAREAALLLAELQNHKNIAVRSAAEYALSDLNRPEHPESPKPTNTPPAPIGQAAKGPEPLAAGRLTFQVESVKTQKSYEYSDYRGNASITAKAAHDTLLVVKLCVHNAGQEWETFSSSSFGMVDKDGKPVDATFLGFGNNVIASGEIGIGTNRSDGDGNTFLKIKGRLDANDPKNTLVDWELAPGKIYTEAFLFVIPAQTLGARFEMAKNVRPSGVSAEAGANRKAKVGDWVQYEETVETMNYKTRCTVKLTVTSVDDATGSQTTSIDQKIEGDIEFIQSAKASVDVCHRLLVANSKSAPAGWAKPRELKESEEIVMVGGKEYKCKRIEANVEQGKMEWKRSVFLCEELGGMGWAKCEASTQLKGFPALKVSRVFLAAGQAK